MSYTFTFSARDSVLTSKIYPPIILEENENYVMGLIDFMTYNTIPNVDATNNKFYIGDFVITLPEGTYEIEDINKAIQSFLTEHDVKPKEAPSPAELAPIEEKSAPKSIKKHKYERTVLMLKQNLSTFKCEIKSNKDIDFTKPNNIGEILGFKPIKITTKKWHYSDYPIQITKVNGICIECNLIQNSFNNDSKVHIIHMFYPNVPPGYKIVENPKNVIYLPINTRFINEIVLKVTDQDGNLINFKGEVISIRLHLKKVT